MPPSKNVLAATLSKAQAAQSGVIVADHPDEVAQLITANSKRLFGFTRKTLPVGLPTEPKLYIYSISEYGENVYLGPGFPTYEIKPCPEGEEYGEPCILPPMHLYEEAKVDQTEFGVATGQQIADALLRIGPGMNASWDRRKSGWFVSNTNPPLPHEVERARSIYTQECQRLVMEANRYAAAKQDNEINATHTRALKFLGQIADWASDKGTVKHMVCVGCQNRIPAGSVFHPACGAVQPGRWADAIELGIKRLQDAPESVQEELTKPK